MKILYLKLYLLSSLALTIISYQNQTYSMGIKKTNKDIWRAIEDNDINMVKKLIKEKGFDANQTIREKWTLLHQACKNGNPEIVKLLLEKGAQKSLEKTDELGQTPLFWACINNNLQVVKLLLKSNKAKEFVNMPNDKEETPLYWACLNNKPKMVALLLEKGAKESVNKANINGRMPLYAACFNKNPIIMKLLLENGADANAINSVDPDEGTPLHKACSSKNLEIIKLLILFGAYLDKVPQCEAKNIPEIKKIFDITKRFDQCVRQYGTDRAKDFSLEGEIQSPFIDELKKSKRAGIIEKTKDIWTEILNGTVESVTKFINKPDFDANETNNDGESLLYYACSYFKIDIVKLLLEKGGAKELVNKPARKLNTTPLYNVCSRVSLTPNLQLELAELLLKNGAKDSVNREPNDDFGNKDKGLVSLFWACYLDNLPLVKLLLEYGANINISRYGYTPIILAKINKNEEMVKILRERGATLDEASPLLSKPKPNITFIYFGKRESI